MDALFFRRLNVWTKFFFGHENTLGTILRANSAGARDGGAAPAGAVPELERSFRNDDDPIQPDKLGAHLENRLLALEARVQTLEVKASESGNASRHLKELAGAVAEAHLKFRGDLVSLIDDHIEVLKLVQGMARHYDGETGKMILAYIHGAESRLEHFQKRFTELKVAGERLRNGGQVQKTKSPLFLRDSGNEPLARHKELCRD